MFAVCVTFTTKPGMMPEFLQLVKKQAENSLTLEAACHRFDVCIEGGDENELFLYELYDDKAAFDAHCETDHFAAFAAATDSLIADKKVKTFSTVISPAVS